MRYMHLLPQTITVLNPLWMPPSENRAQEGKEPYIPPTPLASEVEKLSRKQEQISQDLSP